MKWKATGAIGLCNATYQLNFVNGAKVLTATTSGNYYTNCTVNDFESLSIKILAYGPDNTSLKGKESASVNLTKVATTNTPPTTTTSTQTTTSRISYKFVLKYNESFV